MRWCRASTGFYCPGRLNDDENDPPGSKPIIVSEGGSIASLAMPVVQQELTLDTDVAAYNETALRNALSARIGINSTRLSLSLRAGSLLVTVVVDAEGAEANFIMGRMHAIDEAALSSQLGGIPVRASAPTKATQRRVRPKSCPLGAWCTAGLEIKCEHGFYNEYANANNQSACTPCPAYSTTAQDGSTSLQDCICDVSYYDDDETSGVRCAICMLGTACNNGSGIVLASLPLLHGWWRENASSRDVRQCPDSSSDESGCVGGAGNPCKQGLRGPYCKLCNDSDVALFYNSEE